MWARIELAVRGVVRALLGVFGQPRVSIALLALSIVSVASSVAWSALGDAEAANRFATSGACWAIGLALLADAAIAASRLVEEQRAKADRPLAVRARALAGPALLRSARVAWALALVASMLFRSGFEIRVAEGEEFTGEREQFVRNDLPRRFSSGPFSARFTVEDVRIPARGSDREAAPAIIVRTADGTRVNASRHRPIWLGAGRFLLPVRAGWALRYEILEESGKLLESAIAKLDLHGGGVDSIRFASVPYRVFLALAPEQPPDARGPALSATVYRWKLAVADGSIAPGMPLPFDGLRLRFPESRHWATFRMVSDPGIPLALAAALLGAFGLGVRALARRGSVRRVVHSPHG